MGHISHFLSLRSQSLMIISSMGASYIGACNYPQIPLCMQLCTKPPDHAKMYCFVYKCMHLNMGSQQKPIIMIGFCLFIGYLLVLFKSYKSENTWMKCRLKDFLFPSTSDDNRWDINACANKRRAYYMRGFWTKFLICELEVCFHRK